MPKLVIAARHPGAARGAVSIANVAIRRNLEVEFIATEPAYSILAGAGFEEVYTFGTVRRRYPALSRYKGPVRIENHHLAIPEIARDEVETMATWLRRHLAGSRPDAVLMTDANEQLGVEQVIAVAASDLSIPAFRVRDSWGIARGVETSATRGILDESLRRRGLATKYFEIDRQGARLSVDVLGIPEERLLVLNGLYTLDRLVGSLTPETSMGARAAVGVGLEERLVVYFAQPTGTDPAEEDAFEMFMTALDRAGLGGRGVVLGTQEHPREGDPHDGRLGFGWTAKRAASRYRGKLIDLSAKLAAGALGFEDTMRAADVFVSTYSNSSIEATVLGASAAAGTPAERRVVGIYALGADSVRRALAAQRAGLTLIPFAENGAVPYADRPDDLAPLVTELLLSPERRQRYFDAMHVRYNLGRCAARVVAETLGALAPACGARNGLPEAGVHARERHGLLRARRRRSPGGEG